MSETISIGTSGGLPRPRELRLAVAMRGGVSLAVWMGGACQEIEALRRSARSQPGQAASKVYRALLDRADYNKVVVDVLAGTSAGGLNAVLLSCALLYDMPFDAHVRDLWLRVADILRLCRPADDRDPQSLLQGDAVFYQDLMGNLRTLLKDKLVPRQSEHEQDRLEQVRRSRVDLILTCTLLQPAPEDFHQPIGDPITDARSRAYFRFRNLEQGEVSDFDPSDEGTGARGDPWEPVRRLAYAGRSTSSYPGAFEPATIWAAPGDDRSEAPGGGEPHPRNMHGVFSESMARRPTAGEAVPAHVIDGGVLDNIPIAWAIRSIAAARANRPVDRWLLYLQPVPPSAPLPLKPDPKDRGRLLRLVPVTVKAHSIKLGSESLLEDVDELRRYATAAGQRRRVADALATTPLDLDGLLSKASAALENQAAGGYRTRQAAVEASRLARLLEAPVEVTGPDPLPFGGVRDPLDQMSNDVAADLLAQLAAPPDQELEELVLPDGVTGADLDQLHRRLRNLQAVGRAVATLLDCARDLERQGEEVPSATGGGDVRAGDVAQNELFPLRFAVEMVVAAHDRLVLRRCAQIGEGASPSPDAIVRDAAAALRQAAEAAEVTTEPTNVEKLKNLSERVTRDDPLPRAVAWPEDGYGWLWEPLAKVAERLARAIPKNGPAYAYLRDAADRQPPVVLQALLATEVLFGPLRPDPLSENASIRFHMISAANQSPLNMSIFNTATPTTNQKLAGNQLNNFGAFLSARWRQNDWTWGRLDAATSLVRLLTRPERVSKESLQALVADLGLDPGDRDREELVDQVLGLLHEQILSDELPVMAGLRDEPPTGTPTPAPQADRKLLATVGAESVQNLPEARRRQVIGRISRLLWRSLKDVPRGRARIWRGAVTVTEPIGAALVRFGLRRFVK